MSQDTYNKIYTLLLTSYFMAMYTMSWYTGKPLDLVTLAAFLIPGGVHGLHLLTQSGIIRAQIKMNGFTTPPKVQVPGANSIKTAGFKSNGGVGP